jgi:hypothetical protein
LLNMNEPIKAFVFLKIETLFVWNKKKMNIWSLKYNKIITLFEGIR